MVTLQRVAAAALVLGGAWTCAVGSSEPVLPAPLRDVAAVAQAEAQRQAGVEALLAYARHPEPWVRTLALRGLGRVGEPAVAPLAAYRPVAPEQIYALGMAGASPEVLREVLQAWPKNALARPGGTQVASLAMDPAHGASAPEVQRAMVWALGRLGAAPDLSVLARSLHHDDPEVVGAAAVALGLWGRRRLALDDGVRAQLSSLAQSDAAPVRYGVAYAFAQEHEPARNGGGEEALTTLVRDADAEVRSLALMGLARRGVLGAVFIDALRDPQERVRVQALRGLLGPHGSPTTREAVAQWLPRAKGRHEITVALQSLLAHGAEPEVMRTFTVLRVRAQGSELGDDPLLASAVDCLAAAGTARAGASLRALESCGGDAKAGWPLVERRRLLADLIKDGVVGEVDARLEALRRMVDANDPRVRALAISAGLGAEDERLRKLASERAAKALQSSMHLVEVGSVAEAITEAGVDVAAELRSALLERSRKEVQGDPELLLTLIAALRGLDIRESRDILAAASAHPLRPVRKAAQEAWRALANEDLAPAALSPSPMPPARPQRALGNTVRWHLSTTQGEVVIELWPQAAPWAVAALIALTERGFYSDLSWHRVVPDFVVQGGDPTGSGWGGPGFTLPGEPSWERFERGAVGIADAGLDTGGSQFFIMHSRAPHLEGRYTLVGKVVEGMDVVDRLMVGDVIEEAEVELEAAPARHAKL